MTWNWSGPELDNNLKTSLSSTEPLSEQRNMCNLDKVKQILYIIQMDDLKFLSKWSGHQSVVFEATFVKETS